MLERKKDFAAKQSVAGTLMPSLPRAMPHVKALIIDYADMRVEVKKRLADTGFSARAAVTPVE